MSLRSAFVGLAGMILGYFGLHAAVQTESYVLLGAALIVLLATILGVVGRPNGQPADRGAAAA